MSDAKHLQDLVRQARRKYNDNRSEKGDLSIPPFFASELWAIYRAIDAAFAEPDGDLCYLCACCGAPAYADVDSIDSGTTFTCEKCGGDTVVGLYEAKDYCDITNKQAEQVVFDTKTHNCHNPPKPDSENTQQECPHWCDMLCEQGYSCPNAEPEADTAPADLNRQRCVNLEWRVQTLESQIDENGKRIEAILDLYSHLKEIIYDIQEGE